MDSNIARYQPKVFLAKRVRLAAGGPAAMLVDNTPAIDPAHQQRKNGNLSHGGLEEQKTGRHNCMDN